MMMHAQDDHGLQWNFIKKELIPGVQGANCQVLNSSHDIHKILRAHGLQQQEELEFCV
jgi:hypothetical protein